MMLCTEFHQLFKKKIRQLSFYRYIVWKLSQEPGLRPNNGFWDCSEERNGKACPLLPFALPFRQNDMKTCKLR
jgi:hypothetical protein